MNIPGEKNIKAFWKYLISENIRLLEKKINCKIKGNSRNQFSYFKSVHDFIISNTIHYLFQPKITSFGENIYLTEIINGLS